MLVKRKKKIITNSKKTPDKFYLLEPDYKREIYKTPADVEKKIYEKLKELYGENIAKNYYKEIERLMKVHYAHKTLEMINLEKDFSPEDRFTEKDIILITYGDLIQDEEHYPLEILREFSEKFLKNTINTIHILPFFPYSSDRGFSITDFEEVNPELGEWSDIEDLKVDFKLMFDGVFNHISSKSKWFQEFLNMNPKYKDYFIVFSTKNVISEDHLKLIVRPRTSELLTPFFTLDGERVVWTTFSPDQIDLNYKNPEVLMRMIDILLFYIRKGADIVRLDAVTYIWTELGTSCAHLKETHLIIKLFRDILDAVARPVALITETNVPHKENIEYFGNGYDEAQMVYNFALPPLVLFTFLTGNSRKLTEWAGSLEKPSDQATFFNFLDSHDGIGVMPVKNILTKEEIDMMALKVLEHGGFISYKDNGDGTSSPYELNITWYSAINNMDAKEDDDFQIKRFMASRSIALVLMGVPGIYLHSFFGSKNDSDAVLEEGYTRAINRKTFKRENLLRLLNDKTSTTYKVSKSYTELIAKRIKEKAFHPNAEQKVLQIGDSFFSVLRISVDNKEVIFVVVNVTSRKQHLVYNLRNMGYSLENWRDLISEKEYKFKYGLIKLDLEPYDIVWLKSINN